MTVDHLFHRSRSSVQQRKEGKLEFLRIRPPRALTASTVDDWQTRADVISAQFAGKPRADLPFVG